MSTIYEQSPGARSKLAQRATVGLAIFLAIAIGGLFIVKWAPYYAKSFSAAVHHSIGTSIVSGTGATPPAAGWPAAIEYALAYFKAVWQAVVLALLLGATIPVFLPRRWITNLLGGATPRAIAIATAVSLPGMMCTCCAAPVAVGLRKQSSSIAAATAFLLANPVLNPAVLIFIGFVLSWKYALFRVIFGIALVVVAAALAQRSGAEAPPAPLPSPIEDPQRTTRGIVAAWFQALWWEIWTILPGYVATVLLLGAARAWLLSPHLTLGGGNPLALVPLAIAGTLFVIPTAGEVPIIQTLLHYGLAPAAAATLLVTLPAISLPSLFIVRSAFPRRTLATIFAVVAVVGIVAGLAVAGFPRLLG